MATVFWKGKQWIAQWYRADGTRTKRGLGLGISAGKREAKRAADEMEINDRKQKDDKGRKFEEIVSRAGADAKAGRLSSDRAAEYMTEIRKVSDPLFRVVSLRDYLDQWRGEKTQRVGPSTSGGHSDMQRRLSTALGESIMTAPISDLTRSQIERALVKIKETGLKNSTINLDLGSLRQALKQAVEDGLTPKNVAAGVKRLPEDDSTERAPFTADEVRTMIDHEKTMDEWQGMILFGGHTGLRLGDISKLAKSHIEGTDLVIRPQKTKRQKKTIRIPLTPPLLKWIEGRKGKFFPTLSTKNTPTLSMQFSAIMKRSGVAATVALPGGIIGSRSFHSLRHSFASWLAEADIHADVRQKLTGHSQAGIHAKYTHHDETLVRAIETLPDIGSPRRKSQAG